MAKTRLYILDKAYIKTRKIALTIAYIINSFTPSTTSQVPPRSIGLNPSTALRPTLYRYRAFTMTFTTMAIVEARTDGTDVDLIGSTSLTQDSVSN